jgi:hypothetical protein
VDSFISCTPCSGYDIASQDSNLDDDVLALSGSDSDILETVEKADFVDFLDDDCLLNVVGWV